MKITGVIPARLQSSRLPRKLLLTETGKPLIQYVWEIATHCEALDEVIVATDSVEIQQVVHSFGGRAELTGDHPSGTDRIAEVVARYCEETDIVVNLQGDEPELEPETIAALVNAIRSSDVPMATQRNDSWTLAQAPAGVFEGDIPAKLERGQKRQMQQALKQLDIDRKVFHAKQLLKENGNK